MATGMVQYRWQDQRPGQGIRRFLDELVICSVMLIEEAGCAEPVVSRVAIRGQPIRYQGVRAGTCPVTPTSALILGSPFTSVTPQPWQDRTSTLNYASCGCWYMPKRTEFSVHTAGSLTRFTRSLNNRPREEGGRRGEGALGFCATIREGSRDSRVDQIEPAGGLVVPFRLRTTPSRWQLVRLGRSKRSALRSRHRVAEGPARTT